METPCWNGWTLSGALEMLHVAGRVETKHGVPSAAPTLIVASSASVLRSTSTTSNQSLENIATPLTRLNFQCLLLPLLLLLLLPLPQCRLPLPLHPQPLTTLQGLHLTHFNTQRHTLRPDPPWEGGARCAALGVARLRLQHHLWPHRLLPQLLQGTYLLCQALLPRLHLLFSHKSRMVVP